MNNRILLEQARDKLETKFPNVIAAFEGIAHSYGADEIEGYLHLQVFNVPSVQIQKMEEYIIKLQQLLFWPNNKSLAVIIWDEDDTKTYYGQLIPLLEKQKLSRHFNELLNSRERERLFPLQKYSRIGHFLERMPCLRQEQKDMVAFIRISDINVHTKILASDFLESLEYHGGNSIFIKSTDAGIGTDLEEAA